MIYQAPFPYFGGKKEIAGEVWQRFGDVPNYVEPFFGSGAVLLSRPEPFNGVETVNDADGLICNFWRAVQADPERVAHYADWPAMENDLHARHIWLVERKESLQAKLEGDPDYYDVKIAGWWVWGMSLWIGREFCSGAGGWQVQEIDGVRQLVHLSNAGRGVQRQLVHLGDAGQGVQRQLVQLSNAGRGVQRRRVHLSDAGQGVKRKRVHLSNAGRGMQRQLVHLRDANGDPGTGECGLVAWMQALAERLRRVRVCCGDWKRVCGGKSGASIAHFFASGNCCGIFLDPPYSLEANRDKSLYRCEDLKVAHAVKEWALSHGNDRRLRISLCGYEDEHEMPDSWECLEWKTNGGMANLSNNQGKLNVHRERIWFSPGCLRPDDLFSRMELTKKAGIG